MPGTRQLVRAPATPTVVYSNGLRPLQSDWGGWCASTRAFSVTVDGRATLGAGAADVRGTDGTPELSPRVVLRRGLIELGGGALGYLDMRIGVELDGRGTFGDKLLPNPHDLKVGLPNAWINGEAGPALNLMVGIEPTPFSLEHRTDPDDVISLEQSLASQLAVPFARALGACLWGQSLHQHVSYDVMGITAVGNTLATDFGERGGVGRFVFRPLATDRSRWDRLQIGMSGRWTVRDGHAADASRDDVTTGNGFALFRRRFVDAAGRTEVILPSGAQRGLGFEAVSPVAQGLTLTGEVYLFADDTREAVESLAATRTEQPRHPPRRRLVRPGLVHLRRSLLRPAPLDAPLPAPLRAQPRPRRRPLSPPRPPRRRRRAELHREARLHPAHRARRPRGRDLLADPIRRPRVRAARRQQPRRPPRRVGAGRHREPVVDADLPSLARLAGLRRAGGGLAVEPGHGGRRDRRGARRVDARAHRAGAHVALTSTRHPRPSPPHPSTADALSTMRPTSP